MADITVPTPGASADVWGTQLNIALNAINDDVESREPGGLSVATKTSLDGRYPHPSATAPDGSVLPIWFDSSTNPPTLKFWNGTSWVTSSGVDETGPGWVQSGDSMSLGLASRMATLTGDEWIDNAVGGERSYDIAGRTGANPIWLAVDGGAIPASGRVFVTPYFNRGTTDANGFTVTATLIKQGLKSVNPAKLKGIEGTFTYSDADSRYVFTRTVNGGIISVPYREPLVTFAQEAYPTYNQVFQLGRNNAGELDRVLEDTHAMALWQKGGRKKFLVVGIMNSTTEITGTTSYNLIIALNKALQKEYGFRFVDIRRRLIDDGLAMAGLTPTSQDLTDIANDTIPTQLRATGDPLHLSNAAKDVQAKIVYERMRQIGWYQTPTDDTPPVIIPPVNETVIASDNFATNDGNIVGRVTNNGLGGSSNLAYSVSAGGTNWLISGGTLKRTAVGAAASVLGAPMPQSDHSFYIKIVSVTVAGFIIMARRSTVSGGTDNRITLNPDGSISGSVTGTWVAGDVIGYRAVGTTISWTKNGTVIGTSTATNSAAGFAAVSANANCQFEADDFVYKIPA